MRQHASKQNSIPNNLRVRPTPMPQYIPKDTNKRLSEQNAIAEGSITAIEPTKTAAASSSASSSSSIPAAGAIPAGTFAQKSSRVKDTRDVKAKRNEWRITKMVLAIFLSFVVCYLPITVTKVADKDVQYPSFHIFAYIMLYLSSCINPIIYVIMNKQYRQAYKTVILCKSGRLLGFTHAGSSVGGKRLTDSGPAPGVSTHLEWVFVLEKLKDIGYSYNHSRTIVSQVSVAEDPSLPSSQPSRRDSPHPKRLPDIRDSSDSTE